MDAAVAAERIEIEPLPIEDLRAGMRAPLYRKRVEVWARRRFRRWALRALTDYRGLPPAPPLGRAATVKAAVMALQPFLVRTRLMRALLARLPDWLLQAKLPVTPRS